MTKLLLGLALSLSLLSGCQPQGMVGRAAAPVTELKVSKRDVTVAGPGGFCIDTSSHKETTAGSFVILGSCAALSQGAHSAPGEPAVLTALVSPLSDPLQEPTTDQLKRYFRSKAGLAALAADGKATSVSLIRVAAQDDVLYLNVKDKSDARPDDLGDRSWRAVLLIKGHLVVLSVSSHVDYPLTDSVARATLAQFVAAIHAANPAPVQKAAADKS